MLRRHMMLGLACAGLTACNQPRATIGADGLPTQQVYRITQQDRQEIPFRMLDSVNALRQARGVGNLQLDAQLTAAAATHSRDMAIQNRPWHFGSDGSSPLDRIRRVGYPGGLTGEAISETFETELETLAAYGSQQGTVADMLDRLSLTGALNGEDILDVNDEDEKLVLSSIHQSKGLEFHSVFVPWLADERFPSARALRDEAGIEEERRLFYVACTRAQRELDLLWPAQTYMPKIGPTVLRRSLFVEELLSEAPAVVHRWQLTSED